MEPESKTSIVNKIIDATGKDAKLLAVAYCIRSNGSNEEMASDLYKIASLAETEMSSHDAPAFNLVDYLDAVINNAAVGEIANRIGKEDPDDLFDEIYDLTEKYINRYR